MAPNREKLIEAVCDLWDECPVVNAETWGTSRVAEKGQRAMEQIAGGSAPLRDPAAPVPEAVRIARERIAAENGGA